ncbi:MAG: S41 family peptidase [Lachnospiraceae bacterium]|nr:S41 family peptidase [Lachnospiraceae bacterium]
MEYNLNGYWNNTNGNGEQDEKENMRKNRKSFRNGMISGILLCLLILCCVYTVRQLCILHRQRLENMISQETEEEPDSLVNDMTMKKLEVIEQAISDYYYQEDVKAADMIDGMYQGVVASLGDPYSTYYTEDDLEELMEQTEGIYYGIGAYVGMDAQTGMAYISGVFEGTPAEEAGLRDGDVIYMVNEEPMQGLELSEIVGKIKGQEGTKVDLTIYREGEADYLQIPVERRKIESPTVKYELYDDKTGYIQITEFDEITVDQFAEAMAALREQGMEGLILDLRANPGGNLSAVVEIARQMLPEGLIVYTEDRDGNRTEYTCDGKNVFDMPLVVLINGYSASASEILAGAIKDYGIGELIGTTTFGKGIVQKVMSLSDGTALKLTVSTYFTPKGNNIHGIGVEPDEVYEFDGEEYYENGYDNQLEYAKKVIGEKIGGE